MISTSDSQALIYFSRVEFENQTLIKMHFIKADTKHNYNSMIFMGIFAKQRLQGYRNGLKPMMQPHEAKILMT